MTQSSDPKPQDPIIPTRRDRLKPLELLGFSGVLAVFAGLIVLMASRSWVLALIFAVITFIASVMMVALVGLGKKPSDEDVEARKDLQKPDADWH
ncbi:ABC transporter ATP-binding protein [Leucobacter denitrificans]|uniref:ABC transporter ATP-binding protein n=1 Tax=Leucobacter denitrificans TaxID=683042 RepID=A0A7G9S2Y2_9MICO|nr:ABC transporter ATP-binding protein [Leucobacter denitrificans]QNN62207.1 ABC transporter ATP-binding protein [Leucobacter denitrificans]